MLLQMIQMCLSNNIFLFNKELFKQKCGVAMGVSFSPSFANITMAWWEKTIAWDSSNQLEVDKIILWVRFIDDLFIIWNGTQDSFNEYFIKLNNNKIGLSFTAKSSKKEIEFLDTKIYVEENQLHSTVFRKSTATNSILHATSSHPKSLMESIPYGEMIRMKRNCSKENEANQKIEETISRLKGRGYKNKTLNHCKKRVNLKTRTELLIPKIKEDPKQEKPRFITAYNRESYVIKSKMEKYWHLISGDPDIGPLVGTKPIITYKKNKIAKRYIGKKPFSNKRRDQLANRTTKRLHQM